MIDYQRTVEFLRDFRAVAGQAVTDEVRRAAADYAQLCAEANERLRQCSALLQQGLRSEAIHLANETPNLLELVAALDLPDAANWMEFCQHNDLPVATPLQMERAAQLNDAYGLEQPLDGLLRRHRRLALAHAPTKDRLETLRQIREIDAASAFWESDIRELEAVRMKELRLSFAAALENHDAQAITTLSAEVLQSPWLEPVSKDLLGAAQGAEERLRHMATDTALRTLLTKLRAAYAARDHAACTSLVQQVRKLLADSKQGVSEQTAAEINPIIAWIAQEDAITHHNHAVEKAKRRLAEAIEADAPEKEIEACYKALTDLGEAVPAELGEKRRLRMEERLRVARRRSRVTLGVTAAAAAALLLGGYWYFRSDLASGWARRISEANTARNVARAQELIAEQEKLAPQVSQYPAIMDAKRQAAELQKEFERDEKLYRPLLQEVTQQQERSASLLSQTDEMDLRQLLAAARDDESAAARALAGKPLAWVDSSNRLATAATALQQQAARFRAAADAKAAAQAKALSQRIERVSVADAKKASEELDALSSELLPLRRASGLGEEAAAAIATASEKLEEKQTSLTKDMDQRQQLVALRGRAVSADDWQKALENFRSRYPEAAVSGDCARAIAMLPGSVAVENLASLQQGWTGGLAVTSEAMARKRLQEIKDYLAANPQSPYSGALKQYSQYLTQAESALAVKSSWQEGFRDLLAAPMMADLKYFLASNGAQYYVLGDAKVKISRTNERLSYIFEAIDPTDLTKRRSVTISPPVTLLTEKPVPTPQAMLVQSLSAQIKQISPDNWDSFGITLIEQLLKEKEMNLVVRSVLLQQAMQTSAQVAGWGIGDLYDAALRDYARHELDNIVWYDPDKPVPQPIIDSLQRIADSIPRSDAAMKRLTDGRARLFKNVTCVYATTGALLRDDGGNWAIYPCSGAVVDGSTVLAPGPLPKAADQPAPLLRVGRFDKGKYTVDTALVGRNNLPEGTMVFISN